MSTIRCDGCSRRIGRRGKVLVVAGSVCVCAVCAADPAIHRQLFWSCRVDGCTAVQHQASVRSAADAQRHSSTTIERQ